MVWPSFRPRLLTRTFGLGDLFQPGSQPCKLLKYGCIVFKPLSWTTQNSGTATFSFNGGASGAAAVETPPEPSTNIPFRRDTKFVQREKIFEQIEQIEQKCAVPSSWTALVGLGGVGKSQLAIEYVYRLRERSPQRWVLWIHASNAARFKQSYQEIANLVMLPGRDDPQVDVLKLVCDWLRYSKAPWTVILDNFDDDKLLLDGQSNAEAQHTGSGAAPRTVRDYLPQTERGSILVTSRDRTAALTIVERHDIITVEPMDAPEAATMLKQKLDANVDVANDDIAELAHALEYIPLALAQAVALIGERMPRYSIRQFLEDFRVNERKRDSLLNYEGEHLRRDKEAKNSVIISWQMSFEYIHTRRPSAADLLSLMSFFDRQGIPERLLRRKGRQKSSLPIDETDIDDSAQPKRNEEDQLKNTLQDDQPNDQQHDRPETPEIEERLEADVQTLRNFSFISASNDGESFEMHRLVQLATQKWLEAKGSFEIFHRQFIIALCHEHPKKLSENLQLCATLSPHMQLAARRPPKDDEVLKEWAVVMHCAAEHSRWARNWKAAEAFANEALRARTRLVGSELYTMIETKMLLSLIYGRQGRFEEVAELEAQLLKMCETEYGANHDRTVICMQRLAKSRIRQGRLKVAEDLLTQSVKTFEGGLNREMIVISSFVLAGEYYMQGRPKEAEEMEEQGLELRKHILGVDFSGVSEIHSDVDS